MSLHPGKQIQTLLMSKKLDSATSNFVKKFCFLLKMSKKCFLPNVNIYCPFVSFPCAGFDYEIIPWEAKFSLHNFLNLKALYDIV